MDPLPGTASEFLPNELDLPPGVLAELYRRRWSVEKVFDQLKNKLDQQQAWGSSLVPRKPNPSSSCSPTTGVVLRRPAGKTPCVTNQAEDQRRDRRTTAVSATAARQGTPRSTLVVQARRATQCSVKFLRWLRHSLRA